MGRTGLIVSMKLAARNSSPPPSYATYGMASCECLGHTFQLKCDEIKTGRGRVSKNKREEGIWRK